MTQEQEHYGGKNDKKDQKIIPIPEPYAESNAACYLS